MRVTDTFQERNSRRRRQQSSERWPSSGAISTGTIAPLSTAAFGNNCRRHLNRWLLFTS
jgi:hypothetical protein